MNELREILPAWLLWTAVIVYLVETIAGLYLFFRLIPYFADKLKYRVMPLFLFMAWLFVGCYSLMSLAVLVLRIIRKQSGIPAETMYLVAYAMWSLFHAVCALSLVTLGVVIYKRRDDLYIRLNRKGNS